MALTVSVARTVSESDRGLTSAAGLAAATGLSSFERVGSRQKGAPPRLCLLTPPDEAELEPRAEAARCWSDGDAPRGSARMAPKGGPNWPKEGETGLRPRPAGDRMKSDGSFATWKEGPGILGLVPLHCCPRILGSTGDPKVDLSCGLPSGPQSTPGIGEGWCPPTGSCRDVGWDADGGAPLSSDAAVPYCPRRADSGSTPPLPVAAPRGGWEQEETSALGAEAGKRGMPALVHGGGGVATLKAREAAGIPEGAEGRPNSGVQAHSRPADRAAMAWAGCGCTSRPCSGLADRDATRTSGANCCRSRLAFRGMRAWAGWGCASLPCSDTTGLAVRDVKTHRGVMSSRLTTSSRLALRGAMSSRLCVREAISSRLCVREAMSSRLADRAARKWAGCARLPCSDATRLAVRGATWAGSTSHCGPGLIDRGTAGLADCRATGLKDRPATGLTVRGAAGAADRANC